eukprot:m.56502 g.56502  ORF g.56502 m.56502 type:complete len:67 (+) comp34605_c0_seq2:204-404(+)
MVDELSKTMQITNAFKIVLTSRKIFQKWLMNLYSSCFINKLEEYGTTTFQPNTSDKYNAKTLTDNK